MGILEQWKLGFKKGGVTIMHILD